jgi:hypothetical protein
MDSNAAELGSTFCKEARFFGLSLSGFDVGVSRLLRFLASGDGDVRLACFSGSTSGTATG